MKFAHIADCHIGGWREPKLSDVSSKVFFKTIDEIKEQYGHMRTIKMDIKNIEDSANVDIYEKFGFTHEDAITWTEDNSYYVKFNKNKVQFYILSTFGI